MFIRFAQLLILSELYPIRDVMDKINSGHDDSYSLPEPKSKITISMCICGGYLAMIHVTLLRHLQKCLGSRNVEFAATYKHNCVIFRTEQKSSGRFFCWVDRRQWYLQMGSAHHRSSRYTIVSSKYCMSIFYQDFQ